MFKKNSSSSNKRSSRELRNDLRKAAKQLQTSERTQYTV